MIEKVADREPPGGLLRAFARAPIGFYRLGLGWLFGGRFLMLTHTGRVTGKQRNVVLEVVRRDAENDAFYLASGWGEKSDWLLNIGKNPSVTVGFKRRSFPAVAERLSADEAELEMLDYGRRHPAALMQLARVMGYKIEPTETDYRELGRNVPMIRLRAVSVVHNE
ncbi:MAG: nitroreductase family deazaflavin-dependent oxidoreductase [Chloroflexota bacterium]|nr:nitroreductase family deazaflavin-dependent oxidoreductase [Chloroflexota bacterium]